MKNTCYVVMPYGGNDPASYSKYKGIYDSIIKPAAIRAGFTADEVFREDHSGEGGSIVRSVINHISSSAIVIVDLTGANANVYYEMGLAHVFHKNSTVLICEKGSNVRFDVSDVKRVEYATDIIGLERSIQAICDEILNRLNSSSKLDNRVHEFLPKLPTHLVDLMEETDDNSLRIRLEQVTMERDRLLTQLKSIGLKSGGTREVKSVRSILERTKKRMKYSGTSLIETLRDYANNDDLDSFLDHLIEAMEYGALTLGNINSIVEICSRVDNDALMEDVLTASLTLYPDDPELMTRLAKILARRPDTRAEAMEMVNEAIGLHRGENGDYISVDRAKVNSHNDLARFLDTYLAMDNYDGLVEAATFLMDYVPPKEREMLYRNIFTALTRSGKDEDAEKMLPLLEEMNTDISMYLIATFYNQRGEYIKEYEYIEKAFAMDPEDMDYPRIMAAHMLNENLVRTPEGIREVKAAEAREAAAAMLYYALEHNRTDRAMVLRIGEIMQRSRNSMDNYWEKAVPFVIGEEDALPYEITNRDPLDHILNMANHC